MEKRTCKQCGKKFTLSNGEIEFYKEKKLSLPKRCKKCREKNKIAEKNKPVLRAYLPEKKGGRKAIYAIAVAVLIIIVALTGKLSLFNTLNPNSNYCIVLETINPSDDIENSELKSMTSASNENDVIIEESIPISNENDEAIEESISTSNESDVAIEESIVQDSTVENTTSTTHSYTFSKVEYRDEHFAKHGAEFNYSTAAEYEVGASRVINSSEALHKIEKEDGDDVYYIESTNEFVILATYGSIRTYFKPDDGIEYYNRQ